MKQIRILITMLSIVVVSSCRKDAGEGGTSTIRGKVYVQDYNSSGQLQGEFYAPEERVYILYGDEAFYGNDTRTSFDGTYEFHFLRKGSYTVFAYEDCDTCASGVSPVMLHAEITQNNSTVELNDLLLIK